MNSFWKQVLMYTTMKKKQKSDSRKEYSKYELAMGMRELRIEVIRRLKDFFLISAGILSAVFGLKSFILPSNFIDGGATGISLLIGQITGVPLYILIMLINVPFVFLGWITVGRQFAIKTALAISGLALCVALIQMPEVTHDKLLVAVFGGSFLVPASVCRSGEVR